MCMCGLLLMEADKREEMEALLAELAALKAKNAALEAARVGVAPEASTLEGSVAKVMSPSRGVNFFCFL